MAVRKRQKFANKKIVMYVQNVVMDARYEMLNEAQKLDISNVVCRGRIKRVQPEFKISWDDTTMHELAEFGVQPSDINVQYAREDKAMILEGIRKHDDMFKHTHNNPPDSQREEPVLTSEAEDNVNTPTARERVVTLRMDNDESHSLSGAESNDIMSDESHEEEDGNFRDFTDEVDVGAVTDDKVSLFSQEDEDQIDIVTDNAEIDFTNLVFEFEECRNNADINSGLTKPLTDANGNVKPEGRLKDGVADSFNTIFECVQKCGGMDMTFLANNIQ